jgi:hypothetical protein
MAMSIYIYMYMHLYVHKTPIISNISDIIHLKRSKEISLHGMRSCTKHKKGPLDKPAML